MEPSKETISVRVNRLNNQILNKLQSSKDKDKVNLLTRESLLDALQVLYDECNSDYLKTDKNISTFVDKFRRVIIESKQLRVNLNDFEVKNVIGRGHFGEVHVIKEKQTGDVYAMKTVRKYENLEHKCALFEEERNIMVIANSPWITRLQYAFQDSTNLYFIMEYHPGGDLLGLLYRQGGTIPESAAVFYVAELAIAINDLHSLGFVHRDIKPDNILLDRCGHLKLADFGSAGKLNAKGLVMSRGGPVGTPDYIAPEALQSLDTKNAKMNNSYGKSCDYWSLGILAYELTIGNTPFKGQNTTATYSKIMNYTKNLKFPTDISLTQAFIDLIKNLLTEQKLRLTYNQIEKHDLFKNIDFNSIRDQVPPFVPKILSLDDTSNFSDIQIKKKQPFIENFKPKTQFNGKNLPFIGFTFTTEPNNYKESYRASTIVKDVTVDNLKKELSTLERKIMKQESYLEEKENLDKKFEENSRKLESLESVRDRLERDLANSIAECQALKRTLDLERKDRSDLERKALELIKSAKLKWEAAEKTKLESINKDLAEYKEKNEKLLDDIKTLSDQLQNAIHASSKHKASFENIEKLRRSSVIGLESRLEKVCKENQAKIMSLQIQLCEEVKAKDELNNKFKSLVGNEVNLKNKLNLSEKHFNELKEKCIESDAIIHNLKIQIDCKTNDLEQYTRVIHALEQELENVKQDHSNEEQLKDEKENNRVLKKQVKDLKTELNTMRATKLSALDESKAKYERKIVDLEQDVKNMRMERNDLYLKNHELTLSLQNKQEKFDTLEELMTKLQSDLSKLESGSERETVLQEQVERLEQQLVEVSENAALEKQEYNQLKTKFWRLEKDLGNAELDKRIVERDLKEEKEKNKDLLKDFDTFNEKIINLKKTHESAITEMAAINEKVCEDLLNAKDEVKKLDNLLAAAKRKEDLHVKEMKDLRIEIDGKELKVRSVLENLDKTKQDKHLSEANMEHVKAENAKLNNQLIESKREIDNLKAELERSKSELNNSHLNRKTLREACVLLENQLIEFENVLDSTESKRQDLQKQLETAQAECVKVKEELRNAKKLTNEEKSMKLLAETKLKRLLEDMGHLQRELDSYKNECSEFKSYSNNLSDELTMAEQKLSDYEITIKAHERQIEKYIAENSYLKEESSEQLTFIGNLKESNYKLGKSVNEAQINTNALIEKIAELESVLEEKAQYYNERELKTDATMQQQTKLIDFLQSKIEENNKKKKTFSDKLFGHSKKENLPPIALNYKDLELQLCKEKEENKNLRQEIIKLKADLYKKSENDLKVDAIKNLNIQSDILEQIVQSPSSQKNDLFRQNSVQRMHHNIPHRFESKLCTKMTKCAQCNNQILLGRNMSVCRECHLSSHTNCANILPRTCGLPSAYAKHYSERLSQLSANKDEEKQSNENEQVNIEGWIKVPTSNGWTKQYACLTSTTLNIYEEPANNSKMIKSLQLTPVNEHSKVILEPLPSEIQIPVASSDLPFVIKVEVSTTTTCWPPECVIFMTLSNEDKEKWFKALQNILQTDKIDGEVILQAKADLEINSLVELTSETKLLGTESGLYSYTKSNMLHILGPLKVYDIAILPSINLVLLIVDETRILISCDLKHLINLTLCASCTKPTLKFNVVSVNNLNNFHILKTSDFVRNKYVCVATTKQLIILKYDSYKQELHPIRILDTAEPVSCILFTEHSIIIGADRFFEVDLNTFEADEFLDESDSKLSHAVKCYKLKSFPLAILHVNKSPIEYLACYNEFGVFVDEYGRSKRGNDIVWSHLPKAIHLSKNYLYIVQFNGVEIIKLNENSFTANDTVDMLRIDLQNVQFLGSNDKGIYLLTNNQIRFINALQLDDNASTIAETVDQDEGDSASNSDRFSFTSSMIQSLDGNLSDDESELDVRPNRKVAFSTDL